MSEKHLYCSTGLPDPFWVSVSAQGAFIQHYTVVPVRIQSSVTDRAWNLMGEDLRILQIHQICIKIIKHDK